MEDKNSSAYEEGKKAGKAWNGKQMSRPENPYKRGTGIYAAFEDGFADGAHPSEARSKNPYLQESTTKPYSQGLKAFNDGKNKNSNPYDRDGLKNVHSKSENEEFSKEWIKGWEFGNKIKGLEFGNSKLKEERDKDIWDSVDAPCPKCGQKSVKQSRDKKMFDCKNCRHAFQNKEKLKESKFEQYLKSVE